MCFLALALVLVPATAFGAYRYFFGKWPLKLNA
jgi:hypothetical protein